jgi:FkbM family methyltransferase
MSKTKQLHFYGKIAMHRPRTIAPMLARRVREAVLPAPSGLALTHFGNVAFFVDMSAHAIARKYYFHTHEMFLEELFRRHLGEGSVFIDIGANLGYWSAFAASLVGTTGEVHAFEPVPRFFESVARLARENPRFRIFANNAACGAAEGTVEMQVVEPRASNYDNFDTNIGSSSALPGFLDHQRDLVTNIEVRVTTLDDYLAKNAIDLDRIGLIKIDVEGYESFCLDGMKSVLEKPGRRVPLLCEILTDPKRHELLDGRRIVERLRGYGYTVLDVTTNAPIDLENLNFEENILCV